MKRSLLLVLTIAIAACGGDAPPTEDPSTATETSSTDTAAGYVENVTKAQGKARAMAEDEGKRVKEVDEAMKDQ